MFLRTPSQLAFVLAASLASASAVAAEPAKPVAAKAVAAKPVAAKVAKPGAPALPRPQIVDWTLANGMRVVYLGVHRAPVVTVQVWYHVGSKDEPRDRRGSAHMFEHMMFKGTTHVAPEEHARLIDRVGGDVNAFTREDVTAYHNTLPAQYLDFATSLEAERMRNLIFRKGMIDTEREVVKEEIRGHENNPILVAVRRFRELAFEKHPYAWDPGGRLGDLDATSPDDLKKFYDAYYQPNNATLVIVGDVTEAQVRAVAEKHFATIAKGGEPPRPAVATPEPKQDKLRREVVKASQLGLIIGGYKIPEAKSADQYVLDVIVSILSGGESSRLNQRVVRKDQVGVAAGAQPLQFEDPGLLLVFGVHLAADQAPKVEAALLDEVGKLRDKPVSAAELEKAKNQLAARFVMGLESVNGLADQIGTSIINEGDPRAWLGAYDRYLAVTAADVQRVAKQYLVPEGLTVVVIPPLEAGGGGK